MEIDSLTHPNPTPDPYHRKIELQSPLDVIYLQTNLSNSARQKLDLHFPLQQAVSNGPATVILLDGGSNASNQPSLTTSQSPIGTDQNMITDEEEDPLRRRVRELVDTFMHRTWSHAAQSISVNGLDATTLPQFNVAPAITQPASSKITKAEEQEGIDFTYAAYDNRLQSKVASLYGELEVLTAQVSKLRRDAPIKGAEMTRLQLQQQMEEDEAMDQNLREEISEIVPHDMDLPPQHSEENWAQDIQDMYERGLQELKSLGGLTTTTNTVSNEQAVNAGLRTSNSMTQGPSLTETVGKVQRAKTVAMEFE